MRARHRDRRGGFRCFAAERVVKLPVSINGTRGVFLLDTGATFVSLKNSFAQKAKVQVDCQQHRSIEYGQRSQHSKTGPCRFDSAALATGKGCSDRRSR